MSKDMNLDFSSIAETPQAKPKPDSAHVKEVARQAGAAEGFTDRQSKAAAPLTQHATGMVPHVRHLRPPMVQMNLKVPETVRSAFMEAYDKEMASNRAIRSLGDFLDLVFTEWQEGRGR